MSTTWHDASHSGVSIFLNKENLVFAMPLISVCGVYAYFKFLPLNLSLSIVGAGIVIYKLKSTIQQRLVENKEAKIANLDESFLEDIAADEINREKQEKQKAAKKKIKAENKVRQRIAAEKKKYKNGKSAQNDDDGDEDDDEDVTAFVKRNKKKN